MKKLYIFALMVAFLVTSAVADDDPPPRGKAATITIITNPTRLTATCSSVVNPSARAPSKT